MDFNIQLVAKPVAMAARAALLSLALATHANALTIDFQGNLDIIDSDLGGAVYSGVPLGTVFTGRITNLRSDGSFAGGVISDGTTSTSFSCGQPIGTTINDNGEVEPQCGPPLTSASGPSVSNNLVIDADQADFINSLLGTPTFSAGDTVDEVNIEGDSETASGTRIEAGLSIFFPADTFADGLTTFAEIFPFFDPTEATVALFFILEDDGNQPDDIYSAIGLLDMTTIPLPAAVWLFGSGLLGLLAFRKRR